MKDIPKPMNYVFIEEGFFFTICTCYHISSPSWLTILYPPDFLSYRINISGMTHTNYNSLYYTL